MAKITQCDRCGAIIQSNEFGYEITAKDTNPWLMCEGENELDLCVNCSVDFKAFLRNEDVSRRYNVTFKKEETK